MRQRTPVLFICVLAPLLAWGDAAKVSEFMLDNGMKIVVKEDHRSPVMVSQLWYKVGSSYEHDGITGVSHVLEHMMFKGTAKLGPNEFSRIIAENGGRENAFTGRDYTAYFQQMEKSRLEVSFELEADRMRNLRLDPAEFAKEVQVVMEERRMRTEDDPQSLTYEQFAATAFLTSPYHHPVIGWMDDLKNMTVSDLARWYQHFYAPNNAVLVVVGDVDPDHVLALARKHFGALKPSPLPVLKPRGEIPQQGERRIIVRAPAELPYLVMGYKVPVLKSAAEDWEPYALEVLAGVLDGGASARFASRLVRGSEVAASVGAGYSMTDRLPGLFLINGTPAREHTIEELRSAIKEQVGLLKSERVSEAELKRVKAQVMASEVYQNDSTFYQAMEIGMLESVGLGWRTGEDYLERVNAVTAEQVRAVARKYLVDDRLTVAILDPLPMDRAAALRRSHGGQHVVR